MKLISAFLLVIFLAGFLPVFGQSPTEIFTDFSLTVSSGDKAVDAARFRQARLATDLTALTDGATIELALFEDAAYTVKLEQQPRRHNAGNVEVYWANSGDPAWAHLPNYHDVIVTVNRETERVVINAITSGGSFMVLPSATDGQAYRLYEERDID